jgi:hypothetical protein
MSYLLYVCVLHFPQTSASWEACKPVIIKPCGCVVLWWGQWGCIFVWCYDSRLVTVQSFSLTAFKIHQECDSWPQQPALRPSDILVVLGRRILAVVDAAQHGAGMRQFLFLPDQDSGWLAWPAPDSRFLSVSRIGSNHLGWSLLSPLCTCGFLPIDIGDVPHLPFVHPPFKTHLFSLAFNWFSIYVHC